MAFIRSGQTKDFTVWTRHKDILRSSKRGLRTFTVWVPDNTTVVEAIWEKECQGGIGNWKTVGRETITGRNVHFSRTVPLAARENLKLTVRGVQSSPGKRRKCYYSVQCSEWFPQDRMYKSDDFSDTETWFRADDYLRWYWCGTTSYVVVNEAEKELLLIDAYVSKATIGGNQNFTSGVTERKRIVRWVNLIRRFIADGYKIVGLLTSHDHGDHIGDLPYLLGGITANAKSDFLETGMRLTGRKQTTRIPVVMCEEAFRTPYFHSPGYDEAYVRPERFLWDKDISIFNRSFRSAPELKLGSYSVTPYIWYHGKIADGRADERRTLAYLIGRRGSTSECSRTFLTTGYCERVSQLREIDEIIRCHHMIFASKGKQATAVSAKSVRLLQNSPIGANFIFAAHTDRNSKIAFSPDVDRKAVTRLFSNFLHTGLIQLRNGRTFWLGNEVPIRLGYWGNRLADG